MANFPVAVNRKNLTNDGLVASNTIPEQNTTGYTTALNLGGGFGESGVTIKQARDVMDFVAYWDALTGTTGQTLTLTVQDSADNSSFAAVGSLQVVTLTAASSAFAAGSRRWQLPANVRQYVRLAIAASATAGTSTSETINTAVAF